MPITVNSNQGFVLFNPWIGPLSGATTPGQSGPGERWQWRGTPYSPKLHHHLNITIRLFSVISKTLVGGGGLTPLQRSSVCILQPQLSGLVLVRVSHRLTRLTNVYVDREEEMECRWRFSDHAASIKRRIRKVLVSGCAFFLSRHRISLL